MNYSYVMGISNIDELKQANFKIKSFGNNYGIIFDDNKIELFEKYICQTLENGFWNEYLGKDKVFIFKFKKGNRNRAKLKPFFKIIKWDDNSPHFITKFF